MGASGVNYTSLRNGTSLANNVLEFVSAGHITYAARDTTTRLPCGRIFNGAASCLLPSQGGATRSDRARTRSRRACLHAEQSRTSVLHYRRACAPRLVGVVRSTLTVMLTTLLTGVPFSGDAKTRHHLPCLFLCLNMPAVGKRTGRLGGRTCSGNFLTTGGGHATFTTLPRDLCRPRASCHLTQLTGARLWRFPMCCHALTSRRSSPPAPTCRRGAAPRDNTRRRGRTQAPAAWAHGCCLDAMDIRAWATSRRLRAGRSAVVARAVLRCACPHLPLPLPHRSFRRLAFHLASNRKAATTPRPPGATDQAVVTFHAFGTMVFLSPAW